MKSDLSNVKKGDKIWTIQEGWTKVETKNILDFFPKIINLFCIIYIINPIFTYRN
jgi:hypothetical protein